MSLPASRPAPVPTVATEPPPPTLTHRVWFAWDAAWSALMCTLLSPGVVIESALRPTAETFARWMRPWGRAVLWGCRIRLVVEERAPLPDGPVVFVANHQSALDVAATSAGLPRPFLYVARHELRAWPIIGWVLEKTACVFIDRSHPRKAVVSLQRAGERIRGGDSVLLFPEGGRSYAAHTQPFMRGSFMLAVEAGVPIVPVALIGHVGVIHEKQRVARPGEIRLVLGVPIPTEGLERRDTGDLAERVRAAIEAELSRFDGGR